MEKDEKSNMDHEKIARDIMQDTMRMVSIPYVTVKENSALLFIKEQIQEEGAKLQSGKQLEIMLEVNGFQTLYVQEFRKKNSEFILFVCRDPVGEEYKILKHNSQITLIFFEADQEKGPKQQWGFYDDSNDK